VSLTWTASTDNVGVNRYDIYVDNTYNTTVYSNNGTVSGLNPSTTYSFYVVAKDAAGNKSDNSTAIQVTTKESNTGGGSGEGTSCGTEDFENIPCIRKGNLKSSTISGGIGSLSVKTYLPFADSDGFYTLKINGEVKGQIPYSKTAKTTKIDNINVEGDVVIELIDETSNNRVSFDNLSWTCYEKLATDEVKKQNNKLVIYPNPVKNHETIGSNDSKYNK